LPAATAPTADFTDMAVVLELMAGTLRDAIVKETHVATSSSSLLEEAHEPQFTRARYL
jgi:hypothetical protein